MLGHEAAAESFRLLEDRHEHGPISFTRSLCRGMGRRKTGDSTADDGDP
jgi:hypothetical protein